MTSSLRGRIIDVALSLCEPPRRLSAWRSRNPQPLGPVSNHAASFVLAALQIAGIAASPKKSKGDLGCWLSWARGESRVLPAALAGPGDLFLELSDEPWIGIAMTSPEALPNGCLRFGVLRAEWDHSLGRYRSRRIARTVYDCQFLIRVL
jgi:hypothetical protein